MGKQLSAQHILETQQSPGSPAYAASLHELGLRRLEQEGALGAEDLFHKALDNRPPSEPGSPQDPGALLDGNTDDGSASDEWERGLEDNLSRLNVALSSRPSTSSPSPLASSNRQFKGRGARRYSTSNDDDAQEHVAAGPRELHHVLELYSLTPHTKTADIEAFLQPLLFHPVPPVVKWVDDNHALVIFPTADSAQQVLEAKQSVYRIRSFLQASLGSHDKADSELLPPKPRPKTTDVVARRMLSHALGRCDLLDAQGEVKLAQARKDRRAERQNREQQLSSAWSD